MPHDGRSKQKDLDNIHSPTVQSKNSKDFDLPITPQTVSSIGFISAIFLQITTTVILGLVTRYDIVFPRDKENEPISNQMRTGYTAGITVVATLLSTFTLGQIKQLWLARNFSDSSKSTSTAIRERNATLVGLSDVPTKFRRWNVSLALLISGLGTTAFVTGLTPSIAVYSSPSVGRLALSNFQYLVSSPMCFEQHDFETNPIPNGVDFSWKSKDGSFRSISASPPDFLCPLEMVLKTLRASRDLVPSNFLTIGGTVIDNSALGVPYLHTWNGDFDTIFGMEKSNPRTSVSVGQASAFRDGTNVTFHTDSEGCLLTLPAILDKNSNFSMDGGAGRGCPGLRDPGKATLLLGAVGSTAVRLNSTMGPPGQSVLVYEKTVHGMSCEVDILPAIEFQLVKISAVAQDIRRNNFSRLSISSPGRKKCTPVLENGKTSQDLMRFVQSDDALAAGIRPLPALFTGTESNFSTLLDTADQLFSHGNNFFFPDSTNLLEDVLGVASALAMGMHWGSSADLNTSKPFDYVSSTGEVFNPHFNITGGKLARTRAVIGSNDTKAILCILPSAFTAILLGWLAVDEYRRLWRTRKEEREMAARNAVLPS